MSNPSFQRGELGAWWCGGAVYLRHGTDGLLLDAPPGISDALDPQQLGQLRAVVLTSGRVRAVGGLVPLLVALERYRDADAALELWVLLGEERGAMLAETWVRGWPDRYPLTVDAAAPGAELDIAGFRVQTLELPSGEPRFRAQEVVRQRATAVRVASAGSVVAWVPGAAPGRAVERACADADLAVIEVGVVPWPRTERRWRLTAADALAAAPDQAELWVVGDDGRFAGAEA